MKSTIAERRLVHSSSDSSSCSELVLDSSTNYIENSPASQTTPPAGSSSSSTTTNAQQTAASAATVQLSNQHRSSFDLSTVCDPATAAATKIHSGSNATTRHCSGVQALVNSVVPGTVLSNGQSVVGRQTTRLGPNSAVALNRLSAIGTPARGSSLALASQFTHVPGTPTSKQLSRPAMYRLSSFHEQQASQHNCHSPEQGDDLTSPTEESEMQMLQSTSHTSHGHRTSQALAHSSTYETIDVRTLNQHYAPGTSASLEYASSSGSGTSSGPSNGNGNECFEDQLMLFGMRTHCEPTSAFFSRRPSSWLYRAGASDYDSTSLYCSPNTFYSGVKSYDQNHHHHHYPNHPSTNYRHLQQHLSQQPGDDDENESEHPLTSHSQHSFQHLSQHQSQPHLNHHPELLQQQPHPFLTQQRPLPSRTADAGSLYSPIRKRPSPNEFTMLQALGTLISLTLYILTQCSTIVLAFVYYRHRSDSLMSYSTITVLLFPSVFVNILSLKWLLNDNNHQNEQQERRDNLNKQSNKHHREYSTAGNPHRPMIGPSGWTMRILLHVFLLGPIFRYIELLTHGVKSWSAKRKIDQEHQQEFLHSSLPSILATTMPRTNFLPGAGLPHFETAKRKPNQKEKKINYFLLTVYEERDCQLLSLYQSLPQCTFQAVLQLCYFILHSNAFATITANATGYRHHIDYADDDFQQLTEHLQISVILSSLFSLSWSLTGHQLSISTQGGYGCNLGAGTVLLALLWNLGTISARFLSVSFFISTYGCWIVPVAVLHWGVMTIAILHRQHLHEEESFRVYGLHMIMASINLVQLVSVTPYQAHLSATLFYTLSFMENCLFTGAWTWTVIETLPEAGLFPVVALGLFVVISFSVALLCRQAYFWIVHRIPTV